MKEKGVAPLIKIKNSTTHVLLGKDITKYEGIEREDLIFLTDIELNHFLEQEEDTYLKEKTNESLKEDVKEMLLSKNEDTITLALEMLKQGGVDKDCLTALFLIFKNSSLKSKTKTTAKNFLEIHASKTLKAQLNSRAAIFFKGLIKENTLSKNIDNYLQKEKNIDKKVVGQYISEWTGNGYFYWFKQLTKEERDITVNQLIKDNSKFILKSDYFYNRKTMLQYTTAVNVEISESSLSKIPEELLQFKQLKKLDLSNNYIEKLPNWFSELSSLQTLSIAKNEIINFPKILFDMPNLKTIRTWGLYFEEEEEKEILNYFHSSFYELTRK